jgi:23S rRNA pseudouridine2457 synthase
MPQYYIFYKPFQVLSQFTSEGDKKTLADYIQNISKDVYPVGRLDYDSEGLLLLTNDNTLKQKIIDPALKHKKTYWVQVEGEITTEALEHLKEGVWISADGKKHFVKALAVEKINEPSVPERNPPIRFRKNIPTSWIALTITEGKNRQVRKMTAASGFPTLRLIRYSIGNVTIDGLEPGMFLPYPEKMKHLFTIK